MDIVKPKAVKEYASYEAWKAEMDSYRGKLVELTGWESEEISAEGSEAVKQRLADFGHAIVDAV